MVDINNMGYDDLVKLKQDLDYELRIKYTDLQQKFEKHMNEYGNDLIEFINGVTGKNINVKSRNVELVMWRMMIYKTLREKGMSLTSIGKLFGRDHSTIIHSLENYQFFERNGDEFFLIIKEKYDNYMKYFNYEKINCKK